MGESMQYSGWTTAASMLSLLAASQAAAADLHVGSGQTYATVQSAIDAASPGDTVLVHAGGYTENLNLAAAATAAARIVLSGAGDGTATITGRVAIDGSYWDVTDLTFVAVSGSDGFSIGGDHNRLVRLELSGGTNDGIDGGGVANEVRDSHIHDFDGGATDAHCIVLNPGAEDWVIAGNEIHDCSGDTLQLYAATAERTIRNLLVESNHMYFSGALSRTENAIDVKNADGLIIRSNVMHGFPTNKVVVFQKGPANIEMRCNVMYDGSTGIEFRAEDGGTVEQVVFAQNLVHDFTSYALKFDGTTGADVFNNTFVTSGDEGLRIEGAGLNGGNVRNNLFVGTGPIDAGSFVADHNGYFNATTSVASPSDVNADPLLDTMYQLGSGSPMIDAGADVGLPISGPLPDIGWHEVGLAGCVLPPAAGAGGGGGAGTGGATASSGNGAGGSSSGNPAESNGSADEGGCGCRTVGGRDKPLHARLALLLGLALVARSRARRSPRRRCAC